MDNPGKSDPASSASSNSNQPWVSRVYIVDDHRFFTFALTSLVNNEADLAVCGSGCEETSVIADVARLNPDVVVMDVKLSSANSLSLAAALRGMSKFVPILFVSSLQNPPFGVESKWLEPCSFVEKTRDPADIIHGIRQILAKFRLYQTLLPGNSFAAKT